MPLLVIAVKVADERRARQQHVGSLCRVVGVEKIGACLRVTHQAGRRTSDRRPHSRADPEALGGYFYPGVEQFFAPQPATVTVCTVQHVQHTRHADAAAASQHEGTTVNAAGLRLHDVQHPLRGDHRVDGRAAFFSTSQPALVATEFAASPMKLREKAVFLLAKPVGVWGPSFAPGVPGS